MYRKPFHLKTTPNAYLLEALSCRLIRFLCWSKPPVQKSLAIDSIPCVHDELYIKMERSSQAALGRIVFIATVFIGAVASWFQLVQTIVPDPYLVSSSRYD